MYCYSATDTGSAQVESAILILLRLEHKEGAEENARTSAPDSAKEGKKAEPRRLFYELVLRDEVKCSAEPESAKHDSRSPDDAASELHLCESFASHNFSIF